MNDPQLRDAVAAFFDEFVVAFRSFDGRVIALRYLSPYSALHTDGSIDVFATPAEVAAYFQKIVDGYRDQACRSCRYKDLEVVAMGRHSALGTVTWELLGDDGSVLSAWRESYNLAGGAGGLRVFATVDHSD